MTKYKFIFILMFVAGVLSLSACKEQSAETAVATAVTYTCPMHPQVVRNAPGTCPVCGMDLVEFDRSNTDVTITLNGNQVALANITTATFGDSARINKSQSAVQLNGRIVVNPQNITVVSSRVSGRIENLYVKEIGATVHKGQRLYRIYSEELATLQQEYLVSLAQVKQFPADEQFIRIEKAARHKLLLFGQTPEQLSQLASSGKAEPYTYYFAPGNGTIAELMTAEGQYVEEGSAIMRIEGYDDLWVEADLYPNEAIILKDAPTLEVFVDGVPGSEKVKFEFTNPELGAGSQVLQVRGRMKNRNNAIRPGMRARIALSKKNADSGNYIPSDAIIRVSDVAHVWVESEDNKFEPRLVRTGIQQQQMTEIIDGLEEGEKVVVTGAYLLNSEYILKRGRDPMAGHNH